MKIPAKYNLRSLWVRRVGSAMTACGIGLTVAIVVVMLAMVNGLDSTFVETGDELNLLVIRQGSMNEVNSYFERNVFDSVRFLPGIARDAQNEPLVAGELVVVINYPRLTGEASNVMMRATSDFSFKLRPTLEITAGRRFREGVREIIVSRSLSNRFQDMRLGQTLKVNNAEWKVVGIFENGGSAYDSEIWADYDDVAQAWQRPIFSSVLLRAENHQTAEEIKQRIADDQRIQLQAVSQKEYFAQQTISSIGLKALGVVIALLMGVGSFFAIMNMMYGNVMARRKEIATLRALGFKRRSIMGSFLIEAAFLSILGGMLGCLMGSLFHGYSAGTSNFATFSEVVFNFRVTPEIMAVGLAFSLLVGTLGGILPAGRAARIRLIDVLKE